MTTIAWDGQTLAGDRRVTADGTVYATMTKVRRTGDGRLIGAGGDATRVPAILAFLDQRKAVIEWGKGAEAIEVLPDGRVYFHDPHGRVEFLGAQFAIGSGAALAMVAMRCNKSAAEAVELVAEFDTATGGGVDVLPLHPKRAARSRR